MMVAIASLLAPATSRERMLAGRVAAGVAMASDVAVACSECIKSPIDKQR